MSHWLSHWPVNQFSAPGGLNDDRVHGVLLLLFPLVPANTRSPPSGQVQAMPSSRARRRSLGPAVSDESDAAPISVLPTMPVALGAR